MKRETIFEILKVGELHIKNKKVIYQKGFICEIVGKMTENIVENEFDLRLLYEEYNNSILLNGNTNFIHFVDSSCRISVIVNFCGYTTRKGVDDSG